MSRRGPLADSYAGAVVLVICALVPFLALSAAFAPLSKQIDTDLHLSQGALDLTTAMSNAGYAVGTVVAVQSAQHLRQRRMLLVYVTLFVVAAVAAASAPLARGRSIPGSLSGPPSRRAPQASWPPGDDVTSVEGGVRGRAAKGGERPRGCGAPNGPRHGVGVRIARRIRALSLMSSTLTSRNAYEPGRPGLPPPAGAERAPPSQRSAAYTSSQSASRCCA